MNFSENNRNLLKEVDKIFPIYKWNYFFVPFLIVVIIYFLSISIKGSITNDYFIDSSFKTKVIEIDHQDNGYHYKLDSNWFLIKDPIVNHIALGDSIIKNKHNLRIIIKNENLIKWDHEVSKYIIFKKVIKE